MCPFLYTSCPVAHITARHSTYEDRQQKNFYRRNCCVCVERCISFQGPKLRAVSVRRLNDSDVVCLQYNVAYLYNPSISPLSLFQRVMSIVEMTNRLLFPTDYNYIRSTCCLFLHRHMLKVTFSGLCAPSMVGLNNVYFASTLKTLPGHGVLYTRCYYIGVHGLAYKQLLWLLLLMLDSHV